MEDVVKFIFGISGNVIALFLFLSPVPTFWRIIRRRSTEDFSGVPYNMTLLNCLLSAWYGLPFVSPNNILVSTINGAGAAIEAVYVVIFLVFASTPRTRLRMLGLASAVAAVFAAVALVSMLALHHGQGRKLMCGLAATVCSICMYASPLSIMIPNGCGSFLGAAQLVLYAIYRNSGGTGAGKQQAGDDVEMASDAKSSKKVADDVGGGAGKEELMV
ncbi:bidirectional sugar transporter SWEET1b-like isoform X2 [Miscanthus floridulus]|uniref:bidirectional sugar transporter SWEET1b-like isoform X2 n=1 Tax=Miscanthus floridulus TaxID=154761 RepID=UPI00345ABD1A